MDKRTLIMRFFKLENLVAYLLANQGLLQQVSVVSVEGDYLVCNPVTTEGVNTEVQKNIAKPYLLRRTPFDEGSRNGISYSYTSDIARTADDGSETEDQVIVPAYVAGDLLLVRSVTPNTMVTVGEVTLKLIDMNNDGRAWAKLE